MAAFREHMGKTGRKLSAVQETAVATMEKLSAVLGVDFVVYESYVKDGKRVYVDEHGVERPAPSGKYSYHGRVYPAYMNGYEGGTYNVSVTMFDVDGGNVGLFMYGQDKGWHEVFNKQKEGDPAKKFPATRPFAVGQDTLNENVAQDAEDVKEQFSLRDEEGEAAAEAVRKENEKLKEDVQRLRELLKLQRQVTGGIRFTASSVTEAARYLKQAGGIRGNTAEFGKLLNAFYEAVAQDREISWESVREYAQPVVDWMMENRLRNPDLSLVEAAYQEEMIRHDLLRQVYDSYWRVNTKILCFSAIFAERERQAANTFSRGEGGPPERSEEAAGRKRNAGDRVDRYEICQSFAGVGFHPSKTSSKHHRYSVSTDFLPNSSSVGAADSFPPGGSDWWRPFRFALDRYREAFARQ